MQIIFFTIKMTEQPSSKTSDIIAESTQKTLGNDECRIHDKKVRHRHDNMNVEVLMSTLINMLNNIMLMIAKYTREDEHKHHKSKNDNESESESSDEDNICKALTEIGEKIMTMNETIETVSAKMDDFISDTNKKLDAIYEKVEN